MTDAKDLRIKLLEIRLEELLEENEGLGLEIFELEDDLTTAEENLKKEQEVVEYLQEENTELEEKLEKVETFLEDIFGMNVPDIQPWQISEIRDAIEPILKPYLYWRKSS